MPGNTRELVDARLTRVTLQELKTDFSLCYKEIATRVKCKRETLSGIGEGRTTRCTLRIQGEVIRIAHLYSEERIEQQKFINKGVMCTKGHVYNSRTLRIRPRTGQRICLTCCNERSTRYRARKKKAVAA